MSTSSAPGNHANVGSVGDDETAGFKGGAAKARLQEHIEGIQKRLDFLKGMFEGKDLSPFNSSDFKKAIEDHYSLVGARYALLESYMPESPADWLIDPDQREDLAKALGFAVGGASTAKAPSGLDPALTTNPAAQAALAAGADLIGDDSD